MFRNIQQDIQKFRLVADMEYLMGGEEGKRFFVVVCGFQFGFGGDVQQARVVAWFAMRIKCADVNGGLCRIAAKFAEGQSARLGE